MLLDNALATVLDEHARCDQKSLGFYNSFIIIHVLECVWKILCAILKYTTQANVTGLSTKHHQDLDLHHSTYRKNNISWYHVLSRRPNITHRKHDNDVDRKYILMMVSSLQALQAAAIPDSVNRNSLSVNT